ncbi:MAG: Cytochrome c [Solirubrobacteraceae bacterium]|jgi:cytochrome c5|nr:Cytochrome c [Solirubrobacteraceae bacterium]
MHCHWAVPGAKAAVLLVAVALMLAGCGSSGSSRSTSAPGRPSTSSSLLAPAWHSGRELFTRDCMACHSLSGHSSAKQQGGDLLGAHLRRPVLVQFTAEMPVKHPLSKADLNAVVDYVLAVQRRNGHG